MKKTAGGDGHEGDNGEDGEDAKDFDVRIEFKHHNPQTNMRTYSIETVDGGNSKTLHPIQYLGQILM